MNNIGLLKRFRFIILSVATFVMISTAVVFTVLNIYRPMYKASINGETVGYFESQAQFDEVYNTLLIEKKQESPEVKVYLDENPVFEKVYIRHDAIENQNVYTNIRAELRTEYTIYNVKVNNEQTMTFNTSEEAEVYAEGLKKEVEKLEIVIEEAKIQDKDTVTTTERANAMYKDIVNRYKPAEEVRAPVVSPSTNTSSSSLSELLAGGIWPTRSRIVTCHYGGYSGHAGTDIGGRVGEANCAFKAGKVIFAGWAGDYGYLIKLDHGNGIVTYYAHNSSILVSVGEYVEKGQTIALQGSTGRSTGPHLHFEIRVNGRPINAYPYIVGK